MGVETRTQAVLVMRTALQGSVFLLLTTHYFKSLGRKVKILVLRNLIQTKRLASLPRGLSSDVFERASLL